MLDKLSIHQVDYRLTKNADDVLPFPNLSSERIVPLCKGCLLLHQDLFCSILECVSDILQSLKAIVWGEFKDTSSERGRPYFYDLRHEHPKDVHGEEGWPWKYPSQ